MGILARPHSSDPYSRSGFLRCWWPLRDRGSARRPAGLRPRVAFQEPQKHRTDDRLVLPKNVAFTGGRQTPGGGGTRGWPDLRRGAVSPELSLAPGQGAGEAPADLLALQRQTSGVQQPKREDEIFTINEERSLWQKQPGEVARAEEETPFWVTERNQWLIQDVGLRNFTKGESSTDKYQT